MIRRVAAGTAAVAMLAAGGAVLGVTSAAYADPLASAQGTYTYTLVGSDTLQAAGNALANGESVGRATVQAATSNGAHVASFDAFGSSPISISKLNGLRGSLVRPAGSSAGVTALVNHINAANPTSTLVDIARSSRGPKGTISTTPNASLPLAWIPFGRDGVSVAVKGLGNVTLTFTQLYDLYATSTPVVINGVTLNPILPQSNSGTRAFFLNALGVTAIGSQVKLDGLRNGSMIKENTGTELLNTGDVIPFSAAQWIAQSNGLTNAPNTITTGETLASIDFGNGALSPYQTASNGTLSPNTAYYASTFGRTTYLVVSQAELNASTDFASLFNSGASSLNANPDAAAAKNTTAYLKALYGFGSLTGKQTEIKYSTTNG